MSFLERLSRHGLHTAGVCERLQVNPISDFMFLSTAKSGKSRIKNPFLDSPKGTHPYNYILNKQYHVKLLLKKYHLNDHTIGFIHRFKSQDYMRNK